MGVLGRSPLFAAVFGVALSVGVFASAQQLPPGEAIAARQDGMKARSAEMKAIGDAAKAGSITKEDAVARAKKLSDSAKQAAAWFPPGSGPEAGVKTRALPDIWQKPAAFKAEDDKFAGEVAKLAAAAETGNPAAITAAVAEVGKVCGSCHNGFRQR